MRFAIKLSTGLLLMIGLTTYGEQVSLAQKGGAGTAGAGAGTGAVGQTPGTAGPGTAGQAPGGIPTGTPAQLPNTSNFQPGVSQQPSTGGVGLPTAGFNPQPLLTNPQVGQHLGLTSQQLNQLSTNQNQLMNTFNPQLQQLGNLTPAEQQARIQAMNSQFNTRFGTAANSVLTPAQQQRYQQLQLQQPGFSVFAQPNVQGQLKLTPDQISRLERSQADFNRQMQLMQTTQDPARRQQLWEQLQDARTTTLRGVLNQSQLQAWQQMTGQPFRFTPNMMNSGGR